MRFDILAFYGGPDQVMTVTSGLASVLGLLLIFWNKVVAAFFRMIRFLRRSERSAVEPRLSDTDSKSAS
jgi:hypothetical protein